VGFFNLNRLLWQKMSPSMLYFFSQIAIQREKTQRIGVCREVAIMSEKPLKFAFSFANYIVRGRKEEYEKT